ncbi:VanZ family protein [Microvirga roseola]|uniref:VanZ family protein n=1 Tax=Microvirga roseola TaxID=2883126 RepID=UPI001E3DAA61|nr:VanZ family protein [Microvirga roseola]
MLIKLSRLATWTIIAAITVLSLAPGSEMIPIGRGLTEHFLAYLVFAAAAALGYGRKLGYGTLVVIAVVAAALFEFAQGWVPGRAASVNDFAASSLGAFLGVTIAVWLRSLIAAK